MRAHHRNGDQRGWLGRRSRAGAALCAAFALLAPAFVVAGTLAGTAAPAVAGTLPFVTSGGGDSCALMPDQSVWCWGQNTTGELGNLTTNYSTVPMQVAGIPPAIDVAAGHDHTCAIATTNVIWCWGSDSFGELGNGTTSVDSAPVQVSAIKGLQVSAGEGLSCAVSLTHKAYCWGDNDYGELGDGGSSDASTPKLVKGLTGVTAVAAGYFHACALLSSGAVYCWGDGDFGDLGNGATTESNVPVLALEGGATAIAAGFDDTCAILSGGDLKCWGLNNVGQLGIGTNIDEDVPTQVAGLTSGTQQVSLGEDIGCAIADTPVATALCWGDSDGYGELGDGSFDDQRPVPGLVFGLQTPPTGGLSGPSQISAGGHHACVVLVTGKVDCWGRNNYGAVGDGTILDRAIPTPTIGLPGPPGTANGVSAGILTGCAVTSSLNAGCWGQMTGDGSPLMTDHTSAVPVTGLPAGGVSQVSAAYGGCALDRLGGLAFGLKCWGDNTWGELGNNTTTDSTTPVKVQGLSNHIQSMTTGGTHTCALVENGGAWCWGQNDSGQLGDGTTTSSSVPVAVTGALPLKLAQISAADDHTCALLTGQTVECWGLNNAGQLGDGTTSNRSKPVAVTGLTGVVQIALGDAFTCALTGAGGVSCWGTNQVGELGDGSTTNSKTPVTVSGLSSGVVAIAAADDHACAVLLSGQTDCWGDNSAGELGNGSMGGMSTTPVTVSGFTSDGASIGFNMGATSCALSNSEVAECWGLNTDGELGDGSTSDSDVPAVVQGL